MTEPLGVSHKELVALMLDFGIHTSVDRFKRLAIELQQRAIRSMIGEGAAVETRVIDEIPQCWCQTCRPITLTDMRMVLCSTCGNKRCPHATNHLNECSGSNEPGQVGSAYGILEETEGGSQD